jgi:tetratricopeptide (TPR) repeat protein
VKFESLKLPIAVAGIVFLSALHAFSHADRHEMAHMLSEKILQDPENASLLVRRADVWVEIHHFDDAKKDLRQAFKLDSAACDYDFAYGRLYYHARNYDKAYEYLSRSIDVTGNQNGTVYRWRARCLMKQEKPEEAIIDFRKRLELDGQNIEVIVECIEAYEASGQEDGAIACLRTGLEKLGDFPVLQSELVRLLEKTGRIDEAIKVLSRMIDNAPRKEGYLCDRARLYLSIGDAESAKEDIRRANAALNQLPGHVKRRPHFNTILAEVRQLEEKVESKGQKPDLDS